VAISRSRSVRQSKPTPRFTICVIDAASAARTASSMKRVRRRTWQRKIGAARIRGARAELTEAPPSDGNPCDECEKQDGDDPSPASGLAGHSENTTRVPGFTSDARCAASQFVSRTQPWD